MVFGSDCLCYDIINENNPISNLYLDTRGGTVLLNHVDDSVYLSGYSKYSEVQIIENVISSNENLIFDWRDDYNSSSKVIISRDDNVNWKDIIERKNDKIGVGGSLIWEIVSGNENNTFSIDQFGEIKILNNQLLNWKKQRFTLQIRVSDGNSFSETKEVVVEINNIQDMYYKFIYWRSYCAEGDKGTGLISIQIEGQEGDINVLWSTGDTTLNIENIPSGTHNVVITDNQGQSITESFVVGEIPIYNDAEICFITADLLDYTRNKIYIKTLSAPYNVDKYLIFRESFMANQYDLIGQIDYFEGKVAAFVDSDVDNRSKSYRYRVAILDKW